ncbi:MAG: tetratricopeptide repeat protein [Patescibacteria group bacterium]|nr:tetratricopeptide repeat protein [Patescibacteria group bacterium]
MSYQILPNLIFILAVLGMLILVLRRLPEATDLDQNASPDKPAAQRLADKGLPAIAASRVKSWLKFKLQKLWHFMLEAKDLRHTAAAGYKIKKIFGQNQAAARRPAPVDIKPQEAKDEQYFLGLIKKDPKNLDNYDSLGRYYLESKDYAGALDIYDYLSQHAPANPEYHAKLAFCHYQEKQYEQAAGHYQKSLALDSLQPNRYYNLSLAQEALGKFVEAAQAAGQAVTLEPGNVKYYLALANAQVKSGHITAAQTSLRKALALEPENSSIKIKLAALVQPHE